MHLTISSQNVEISTEQRQHIAEKARKSLTRLVNRIEGVRVKFIDVNGPKGGRDTQCKLQISVNKQQSVQVSAVQNNVFQAFAKALSTAKQVLKSRIARQQSQRSKTPLLPKPVTEKGVETLAEHRWQR